MAARRRWLGLMAWGLVAFVSCSGPERGAVVPQAVFWTTDGLADFRATDVHRSSSPADVVVDPSQGRQVMEGFGGAFNEKGWEALQALDPPQRQRVLEMLFRPGVGMNLTFCRVPIGASDYAVDRYTEDDVAGDWALAHFSIERDKKRLIPYIQAAQALQPQLRLWASAWTPPPWMKDNQAFDGGHLLSDPRVYRTYAEYLARFIDSYRAQGLVIEKVAVQNEPLIETHYPSCLWTPDQYRDFVRDSLGPTLARHGHPKAILLGTFNQGENAAHALAVLADSGAGQVGALGLQWDGLDMLPRLSALLDGIALWQTETDCGNWHWKPGFQKDRPPNDQAYASYTWGKMRDYLQAGVTVYDLWNLVLDQEGKSIDSQLPWPQNSAVVVDVPRRQVVYTPMSYAFSSFSRFVVPGSVRLEAKSDDGNAVAFRTPGGKTVVVLRNPSRDPHWVVVAVGDQRYAVNVDGNGFGTLVL